MPKSASDSLSRDALRIGAVMSGGVALMSDVRGVAIIRALAGRKHRQALTQYLEMWDRDAGLAPTATDGIERQAPERALRTAPEYWMDVTDVRWRQTAIETTHEFIQGRAVLAATTWVTGFVLLPAAGYFVWWAFFEAESSRLASLSPLTLTITSLFFTFGGVIFKPAAEAALLQSARLAKWQRNGQPRPQ